MSCILVPSFRFCRLSKSAGFRWGVLSGCAWACVSGSFAGGSEPRELLLGETTIGGGVPGWGEPGWPIATLQAVKTRDKINMERRSMGTPVAGSFFLFVFFSRVFNLF